MMDFPSKMEIQNVVLDSVQDMPSTRDPSIMVPISHQEPPPHPVKNSLHLRGSGSYPTMIRARTASRGNKIAKRTSDSTIITGRHHYHHHYQHHHHGHHVSGTSSDGRTGGIVKKMETMASSEGKNVRSSYSKRKLLNNKRTVYSKATRRKSLENLGLLVRNRCGTAKLQWPSEKKETDVFDLLPEGCIQVRQLIRRGGGVDGSGDHVGGVAGDFYTNNRRKVQRRRREEDEVEGHEDNDFCDETGDENNETVIGKGLPTSKTKLYRSQGRRRENITTSSNHNGGTDWKNKRNISVIVRIRPKQDRECVEKSIVFRTDSTTIVFDPKEKAKDFYFQGVKQPTRNDFGKKRANKNVSFQYDKVYGPETTNTEIFEDMLKNLTDHLVDGYNSTVFAYGATGSGKTYTMIGSNSNPGLTVLMIESLYKRIDDLAEDYDCEVVCSYLEVYNETIKDLLRPEKELSIREDGKKGIIISELSFYKPRGPQELLKLLRSGNKARTQHATDLNAESSRSHAVFEVKLCLKRKKSKKCQQKGRSDCRSGKNATAAGMKYQGQDGNIKDDDDDDDENSGGYRQSGCCGDDKRDGMNVDDGNDYGEHDGINKVEVIQSKLVMVDLAGSERGTAATSNHHHHHHLHHGASSVFGDGARQREGASINKSLLALASCISALADGKCHIPYRNSKLTRLLKDSLNGLCTTVMICNISSSVLTSEDTYNTLKYADKARSIENPIAKQRNVFMEDLIVEDCAKTQMVELQVKNVQLQEQLEEEKLRRELILKELKELQRKNVEMKSEAGQEERNVGLVRNSKLKGKRGMRKNTVLDGRGIGQQKEVDYLVNAENDAQEECCFTGKNAVTAAAVLTEDQLPLQLQQYIETARERAKIFSEYVEFASQTRFSEWALSCKKLKMDMADFLGRLPVEDENYIWFSKLKNEVNNYNEALRNNSATASVADATTSQNDHHHKKYAVKLTNLTEKLELIRQNCVQNSFLADGNGNANNDDDHDHRLAEEQEDSNGLKSQKMVAITMEQFIEFKRLSCEREGNEKVDQFYQQFCHQINNQLMTAGMTLMNALKTVKSVYLHLCQVEKSTTSSGATTTGGGDAGRKGVDVIPPSLHQEYKELLDLVYGPGPPLLPQAHAQEDKRMTTEYSSNNKTNDNVNNDILHGSLSAPQIPPQLSNLGRKSSPIMDDLGNMRRLVDRPLLIQLTTRLETADEETEIKRTTSEVDVEDEGGENEDLKLKSMMEQELQEQQQQLLRSNSTFSRFVTATTANTRKSLSTSHTIYDDFPQPPPATRVQGRESSPELDSHLQHHRRTTCVIEEGEEEAEDEGDDDHDEDETSYNDDDNVEDNDHHYLHPRDNDDDLAFFPPNGPFQVETSVVAANESFNRALGNSLPGRTINDISGGEEVPNLVNPVKRKNSTSFEIIFDRKEEKRAGRHGKTSKQNRNTARSNEKASTPFRPSVMSALSKQKISENHFNNGNSSTNEDWTTTTSSSSGENVMKVCSENGGINSIEEGSRRPVHQQKPVGSSTKRLADQALIEDYCQTQHNRHLHQQTKGQKMEAIKKDLMHEKNDNKNCNEYDDQEDIDGGHPSSHIYQLESMLHSPSSTDIPQGTGEIESNKRGFGNADYGSCGGEAHYAGTTGKVKSYSCTKGNKTDLEMNFAPNSTITAVGGKETNNKVCNVTSSRYSQNPSLNSLQRRGHLKQQQGEVSVAAVEAGSKPDIESSWRSNKPRQQLQCSSIKTSGNKNTGGGKGKSLNPLLNVPPMAEGASNTTFTTPPEFPMNVQGQGKNQQNQQQQKQQQQSTQRLLQYKVIVPGKKSIALHPSKASTDLTARSSEKVDVHYQQQKINHHYPSKQQNQNNQVREEELMVMMMASTEEESEWEVQSNCCSTINMPNTNGKSKHQRISQQHSLLSSARSTMSHQKGPYHTSSKTFTISREAPPTANLPVIQSLPDNNNNTTSCSGESRRSKKETLYRREQHRDRRELQANYYSSNDEEGYLDRGGEEDEGEECEEENNNGNYTSHEDNDCSDTSSYSED